MSLTHTTRFLLTAFLTVAFVSTATAAGHAREGMYLGMELGVAEQDDGQLKGYDNDVPTRCDQVLRAGATNKSGFIDLNAASLALPGADGGCQRGDDWHNESDLDVGIIAGFQAGYMFGPFRAEAEYLYRNHSGENVKALDGLPAGKEEEFIDAAHGVDSLSSHSVFANLYYDFMSDSKFTPYIGAGIGFSAIDYTYDAIFARNTNETELPSTTPPAAAGKTTNTNDEMTDEVFGWQLMVGSDYAIDEHLSVGLKLRYQNFDDPKDSAQWDTLRSHESVIAEGDNLDFDPTVTYHAELEDVEVWAASLNLKYKF